MALTIILTAWFAIACIAAWTLGQLCHANERVAPLRYGVGETLLIIKAIQMLERQICLFDAPSSGEIAQAAKQAITAVRHDNPQIDDVLLAKLLGISTDTLERLEKRETKKVPASLFTTISRKFHPTYVKAYFDLFDCTVVPKGHMEAVNALQAVTALAAKLAASAATGGVPDHNALAGMVAELRGVDAAVANLRGIAARHGIAA